MRKFTTTLFVLFLAFINMSMAQNNWVGITSSKPAEAGIHLLESNIQQTGIQFSVEGYYEHTLRTPRGSEMILSLQNGVNITEAGMPDLPKLYTTIIIPDLYEMDVKVISYKYEEYNNIAIAPSKGHFTRDIRPEDVPFVYGEAYNEDAFWPGDLAQLEDPFIMRDFRGQTVTIFPFQYNPVSQTLRVYTDIVVEVSSTGEPGRDALVRKRDEINIEKDFGFIYNRFFLNMEAANKNYQVLEGEEGSMLIIAYDNFMDAMQPFVDWKRTTGRKTVMVPKSEVGNTPAAIKSYVQNYYDENPDFAHLLLIGDGPQIPPMSASGGPSDNAYGFLVGTNSYNDIFVGRFSAETVAHVATQVERMIHYERDLDETATWLSRGMGVARNEGTGGGHNGGENDYVHMDFIRDTLLNYTYTEVLKRYDNNVPGVPNTSAAQMSGDFNEGIGIVNYCNHGHTTGWSVASYNISHVNQLTNVNMLPFIWSVACINGNFVNNFCFAEAWLRATHEGEPTGAIGMMASTINQLWQPPMTGQDEMVTLLAEKSIFSNVNTYQRTFGGLSINGSMAMIPAHGNDGINTHQTWVLFGDPTLKVRTDTPTPIFASYIPEILIGTSAFEVSVYDAEGATVALTYYDETEEEVVIVGTGVVEGGMVTVVFDIPVIEPNTFTLAIMGFNKVTYINEEIEVSPPDGPYVIFDYFEIDDSQGNNNNQADYGETISLNVSLKNVGIEKAENVSATLTTENEFVTILNNEASWDDIEAGEDALTQGAFMIEIAEDIPDQEIIRFVLEATDGDKTWASNFFVTANAPVLSIESLLIAAPEDKSVLLLPGEEANLVISVVNTGHAASKEVSIDMVPHSFLVISHTHEAHVLSTIEAGETAEAIFHVSVQPIIPPASVVDFWVDVVSGTTHIEEVFTLPVGTSPVYTDGHIPSTHSSSPNTSTPALEPGLLVLNKPAGIPIDSITVEYTLTSTSGAWLSEQRSYLKCITEGGTTELAISSGPSQSTGGSHNYVRTLNIANNIHPDSTEVAFELHIFRTWGGSGSNIQYLYGANNTWKVTLHYDAPTLDVEFKVTNQMGEIVENADVRIAHVTQPTNAAGETQFQLPEGFFYVNVLADGHRPLLNQPITVDKENLSFDIELTRVFNVTFDITNKYFHTIENAIISIDDHTYASGQYEIDDKAPGSYNFTVVADYHHDYTGSIEIVDEDISLEVVLQPDGTNIGELNPSGIRVFPNPFTNQLNLEMAEGIKGDIQVVDVLGNLVLTKTSASGSATLNLAHLPVGNYFVRIITSDRTEVFKVSRVI